MLYKKFKEISHNKRMDTNSTFWVSFGLAFVLICWFKGSPLCTH